MRRLGKRYTRRIGTTSDQNQVEAHTSLHGMGPAPLPLWWALCPAVPKVDVVVQEGQTTAIVELVALVEVLRQPPLRLLHVDELPATKREWRKDDRASGLTACHQKNWRTRFTDCAVQETSPLALKC